MSATTRAGRSRGRRGDGLLEVDDLSVTFARRGQRAVHAVDGVSFSVDAGEVVGLVGESGCGKSVTVARDHGPAAQAAGPAVGGKAVFDGTDLLQLDDRSRCATSAAGTSR